MVRKGAEKAARTGNPGHTQPPPQFPSLRSPEGAVAIRSPRPNPRPSSKSGESNGGGAPLVVGEGVQRGPPRNRSPLAVSFPRFFSAKRNGVAPQREKPSSCFRPRRSGRFSERAADSPLACAIRPPCHVASGGLLSRRGESRQRHAKGNLSRRRFPLESFPIGQGAAAPLRSPGVYGGRETGVWTGAADCHSPFGASQ